MISLRILSFIERIFEITIFNQSYGLERQMLRKDEIESVRTEVAFQHIITKNPRYPQSKKRFWCDKENYQPLYGCAWDRAGNLWKVWTAPNARYPLRNSGGEYTAHMMGMFGLDLQMGYGAHFQFQELLMGGNEHKYVDFLPSALKKIGR